MFFPVVNYLLGVDDCQFYELCRFLIGFVKDPPLIGGEVLESSSDLSGYSPCSVSHRLHHLRQQPP